MNYRKSWRSLYFDSGIAPAQQVILKTRLMKHPLHGRGEDRAAKILDPLYKGKLINRMDIKLWFPVRRHRNSTRNAIQNNLSKR